jgi:hypothetical protein
MTHQPRFTGVSFKVTDKAGRVCFPSYEAYGLPKINEIMQATLAMENVASVEIEAINTVIVEVY